MDAGSVVALVAQLVALVGAITAMWLRILARIDAVRAMMQEKIDSLHARMSGVAGSVKDLRIHVSEHYVPRDEAAKMEQAVIGAIDELRRDIKEHTKTMVALQATLRSLNDRLDRLEREK